MDFLIPAGGATNLPKELVDKIVEDAVQSSIVLGALDRSDQLIELVNEGTLPVIGAEDLTKVYRLDTTADITTLDEMDFDIKTPDLLPIEMGTYIYLKDKQVAQYRELDLENLFQRKISKAIARTADRIFFVGDTATAGATAVLSVADGIEKLGNTTNAANAPVEYSTSASQNVLDAVVEAQDNLGAYGEQENFEDLMIFCSSTFHTAARKSANREVIGYSVEDLPAFGLKNVVHIHGIPVIKRDFLTGEKAVLVNMRGAYAGYYGNMSIDVERKAARRANLMVITYYFDLVWAFTNASSKNEGIITIQKASS